VTVCPHLVFAARTPQSRHDPAEFAAGERIGALDAEVCPVVPGDRQLLPLALA
jgi:hypothetical protein